MQPYIDGTLPALGVVKVVTVRPIGKPGVCNMFAPCDDRMMSVFVRHLQHDGLEIVGEMAPYPGY
jgi:hypothetical protein